MSDYKEKFERWQKKATEKFEEIDAQLGLKDKIEGGARVVVETARTGADYIKTEAEKTDVGKKAVKVAEDVIGTANDAAKTAWNVSEPVRDVATDAAQKPAALSSMRLVRPASFLTMLLTRLAQTRNGFQRSSVLVRVFRPLWIRR